MTRPIQELGGVTYQRLNGAWFTRNLRTSVVIASQLDALAKRSDLWRLCCDQDALDDPRAQILTVFEIDDECLPVDGAPETVLVRSSRQTRRGHSGRRTPTPSAGFDWRLRNDGHELAVSCNFEKGWRQTEDAWRFCASSRHEVQHDRVIGVGVTLSEIDWHQWRRRSGDPSTATVVATEFDFPGSIPPRFQNVEETRGAIRFTLNEGNGEFFMTLFNHEGKFNVGLPWVREGKLFKIRLSEYGLYERPIRIQDGPCVARPFHLELTVTLHQRREPDPPVIRDFDLPLPSAGLVSPR